MAYTAACQVKGGVLVRWLTLRHVRLKVGSWCGGLHCGMSGERWGTCAVAYTAACQVKVLKVGSWCGGLHCGMSGERWGTCAVAYTAACQVKVLKVGSWCGGLHCGMSGERWGPGAVAYTAACQVKGGVLVRWHTLRHVRWKYWRWGPGTVAYTAACQVKVLKVGSWYGGLHCRMSGERWAPGAVFKNVKKSISVCFLLWVSFYQFSGRLQNPAAGLSEGTIYLVTVVMLFSPGKLWNDPPQIATEIISSPTVSESVIENILKVTKNRSGGRVPNLHKSKMAVKIIE